MTLVENGVMNQSESLYIFNQNALCCQKVLQSSTGLTRYQYLISEDLFQKHFTSSFNHLKTLQPTLSVQEWHPDGVRPQVRGLQNAGSPK